MGQVTTPAQGDLLLRCKNSVFVSFCASVGEIVLKKGKGGQKKTKIDTIESIAAVGVGCPPSCGEDSPSLTRPYLPHRGVDRGVPAFQPSMGEERRPCHRFQGGLVLVITSTIFQ